MVYMILGTGFEPMEAIAPCDILRRGGVEVQLAGIGGTLIEAGHGVRVQADCRVEDLKLASTDMVILPGGLGGVHSILACDTAMNFIRLAYEDGKYIAAICAAPTILAQLHITDGRKATCYPGLEEKMGAAVMTACGAVQDGRVITGRAAGSADEFGLLCLQALKGKAAADQVAADIVGAENMFCRWSAVKARKLVGGVRIQIHHQRQKQAAQGNNQHDNDAKDGALVVHKLFQRLAFHPFFHRCCF